MTDDGAMDRNLALEAVRVTEADGLEGDLDYFHRCCRGWRRRYGGSECRHFVHRRRGRSMHQSINHDITTEET